MGTDGCPETPVPHPQAQHEGQTIRVQFSGMVTKQMVKPTQQLGGEAHVTHSPRQFTEHTFHQSQTHVVMQKAKSPPAALLDRPCIEKSHNLPHSCHLMTPDVSREMTVTQPFIHNSVTAGVCRANITQSEMCQATNIEFIMCDFNTRLSVYAQHLCTITQRTCNSLERLKSITEGHVRVRRVSCEFEQNTQCFPEAQGYKEVNRPDQPGEHGVGGH